jgi:hypothetical protein
MHVPSIHGHNHTNVWIPQKENLENPPYNSYALIKHVKSLLYRFKIKIRVIDLGGNAEKFANGSTAPIAISFDTSWGT